MCLDYGEGWLFVVEKNAQGKSRNEERGEEGWALCHKLNIINERINEIILMVTLLAILSVKMSFYHTICLLESHYNTLCKVQHIRKKVICQVNFVGNFICKTYMSSYFWLFLFLFFSLWFPRYYTIGIFLLVCIDRFSDRKFSQ